MINYEEPIYEPVNGVVQPPFIPGDDKPHRHTNQLEFLRTVLTAVCDHKFAWPFLRPVDALLLNLPDYHAVVTRPMDFGTINKRLTNGWYYSATECINDFNTIFTNCYAYNDPNHEVVSMAQTLEQLFLAKLADMPGEEVEVIAP